jgi:hypothetical protein
MSVRTFLASLLSQAGCFWRSGDGSSSERAALCRRRCLSACRLLGHATKIGSQAPWQRVFVLMIWSCVQGLSSPEWRTCSCMTS